MELTPKILGNASRTDELWALGVDKLGQAGVELLFKKSDNLVKIEDLQKKKFPNLSEIARLREENTTLDNIHTPIHAALQDLILRPDVVARELERRARLPRNEAPAPPAAAGARSWQRVSRPAAPGAGGAMPPIAE
jgi:hypothetical protein